MIPLFVVIVVISYNIPYGVCFVNQSALFFLSFVLPPSVSALQRDQTRKKKAK